MALIRIDLPKLQFNAQKVDNFGGSGQGAFRTGWFYPFWYNDDGGFKEHQQLNWTNLYLIRRFGLPDENGNFVIPSAHNPTPQPVPVDDPREPNLPGTGGGCCQEMKRLIPEISGAKGAEGLKSILGHETISCKDRHETLTCYSCNPESHVYHVEGSSINHQLNTVQDQCKFIYRGLAILQKCLGNGENIPSGTGNLGKEELNKQTEEIRNIVKGASRVIEDQNREILEKLMEYGNVINNLDFPKMDGNFEDLKKVLRDTQDDIAYKITKLESLQRKTLEAVLKARPGEGKDIASRLELIRQEMEQQKDCCTNIKSQLNKLVTKDDLKDLHITITPRDV